MHKPGNPNFDVRDRPQAAVQTFLVAQLDHGERSWLMVASIVGSIISIAYLVGITELDVDTSFGFRTDFPMIHGYIPSKSVVREALVVGGIMLFVSGYFGAKLIALAILAQASITVVVIWCSVEVLALFALRYFAEERMWRFHGVALSGFAPSLLVQIACYLGMLAVPFPVLRYDNARQTPRVKATHKCSHCPHRDSGSLATAVLFRTAQVSCIT